VKILEEIFISGEAGFSADPLTYTQIIRSKIAAVYKRSKGEVVKDFEVFLIKVLPKGTKIFDKITEEDQERYCTTSQFGIIGWSFHGKYGKEAAIRKFEELNKELIEIVPDKEIILPNDLFSISELAELNKTTYIKASIFVKENLDKTIKFVKKQRRQLKGKGTSLYKKC
jgi:hypothetical protein